jgi:endonuclease III
MRIELPPLPETIVALMPLECSFENQTKPIAEWLKEHRRNIATNVGHVQERTDASDMKILHIFLCDLLVRNIEGEAGKKVYDALREVVRSKDDLVAKKVAEVLQRARYRWGVKVGSAVITSAVRYFRDELNWEWSAYLDQAESGKQNNFPDDPLLKIKYVGTKVRDLALSNFNVNYAAFDLHVTRVISRIGLVAYGWELMGDRNIDFGTNPSDPRNYLFFHKLFLRLSELCRGKFTPVDLDRVFWHLGRCKCGSVTECEQCPIRKMCLTGMNRGG